MEGPRVPQKKDLAQRLIDSEQRSRPTTQGGRYGRAPVFLQFTAIDRRGHRRNVAADCIIYDDRLPGGQQELQTRSCVHCQMNFFIQPGSGIVRGYCMNCDGATCGRQRCVDACLPAEKWAEDEERLGRGLAALGVPFYL